jgi:hypothetical protein
MPPHTARPVATSAGFRASTVSVKLAIHVVYAMAVIRKSGEVIHTRV